jgi:hypothetical protein
MTSGLLQSRKTKLELRKKSLNDPSPDNLTNYKNFRNLYNKTLRASKKLYFEQKIQLNKKNPKKTWDILKEATYGTANQSTIDKITVNNTPVNDPGQISNEFNKFFTSVGKQIAEAVDPVSKDPLDYVTTNCNRDLSLGIMSQADFINIVNNMEPKNSSDINGMSTKMIKEVKFEIATPLVHIFNLSLNEGIFPESLKCSRTIPIFKAGNPLLCDNYRPISLLSVVSKILEKYVANKLSYHLAENNLLFEHQYGFQKGKSTVHNLLVLSNYVAKEINNKKYVAGIFLDLKKAFDVVNHGILLKKLKKFGITGKTWDWFNSYLSNRSQKVEINGVLSEEGFLELSVLQGSILGPILFLCFINDIYNCTLLLTLLFADDTAALDSDQDLPLLINRVNVELNKLANWFRANKMAVNISKTKYIIFRPRGANIDLTNCEIVFNNNEIGQPYDPSKVTTLERIHNNNPVKANRSYKLLGLYLDEFMTFDDHITHTCNKIAQSNFIINRAKNFLPQNALRTLYFALVHPHLLYCQPIYSCTSGKNIAKLEKMQKKSIRIICNAKSNAHTRDLFSRTNIMPLKIMIEYSQSLLVHSIYHKYCPSSLHNLWITNGQRENNYNLRNSVNLYTPPARTAHVEKMPYFALPKMWNNLTDQKLTPNPTTFKIEIKKIFMNSVHNLQIP